VTTLENRRRLIPDPIDVERRATAGALTDVKRRQREIEARLDGLRDM